MSDEATIQAMLKSGDPAQEAQALAIMQNAANPEIGAGPQGLPPGTQPIQQQVSIPQQAQPIQQQFPVQQQPVQYQQAPAQQQPNQFQQYVQPQVQQAPVDPNVFTATYNGKEVTMPNTDGFLGRGSDEGLRSAFVNASARLDDIRGDFRTREAETHKELAKVYAENEELKKQSVQHQQPALYQQPETQYNQPPVTNGYQQQPQQQQLLQQQPVTNHSQQPNQNGYTPINHSDEDYEFTQGHASQINNGFNYVNNTQASMQTRLDDMEKRNSDYLANKKAEDDRIKIDQDHKEWTGDINSFITKQQRYNSLGGDIYKYDSEVANPFMTSIAESNGVFPPHRPDEELTRRYEQDKNRLAEAFVRGDLGVRQRAGDLQVPEGFVEFGEVSAMIKQQGQGQYYDARGNQIKEPIEDIWLKNQMKNGGIQNLVNTTAEQHRTEGVRAMSNVQVGLHNNAVNLANNQQSTQRLAAPPQMDQATAMRVLNSDPSRRDPAQEAAAFAYVEQMPGYNVS